MCFEPFLCAMHVSFREGGCRTYGYVVLFSVGMVGGAGMQRGPSTNLDAVDEGSVAEGSPVPHFSAAAFANHTYPVLPSELLIRNASFTVRAQFINQCMADCTYLCTSSRSAASRACAMRGPVQAAVMDLSMSIDLPLHVQHGRCCRKMCSLLVLKAAVQKEHYVGCADCCRG